MLINSCSKFDATVPEDLWNGIEPSIPANILPEGTNLSKVMDSWINRAGFPLLQVENNGSAIIVTQVGNSFKKYLDRRDFILETLCSFGHYCCRRRLVRPYCLYTLHRSK